MSGQELFMVSKKRIGMVFLVHIFFICNSSWGYYFQDTFPNGNNWITNLKYNMGYGVWGGNMGGVSQFNTAAATFNFSGQINTPTQYQTSFYGIYSLFTNRMLNASKENPFGFEITRYNIRNWGGDADYDAKVFNLGIVQYKASVTNNNTNWWNNGMSGAMFDYSTVVSENSRLPKTGDGGLNTSFYTWNEDTVRTASINRWTSMTNNAGIVANNFQSRMEWDYRTTGGSACNEVVTFRIVNDGEYISFYVNPMPTNTTGTAAYSNEFYFVGKTPATFANNIVPIFGLAELSYNDGSVPNSTLKLSNLIMRSVCSNLTSEIAPAEMNAGATNHLYIAVKPSFSNTEEAGIQELYIDLPDSYTNLTNWTAFSNKIGVYWVNTNGSLNKTFGREYGDRQPAVGNAAISLKNGNSELKIRFCASNSVVNSDVFHPLKFGGDASSNAILVVISNFYTPSQADAAGQALTVYANNEKYVDTTWTNVATTFRMKSYGGNVVNMSGITNILSNYDTLTYKTYNGPTGHGSILPTKMYEDVPTIFYYNLSALFATNNNANITRAFISIPDSFDIDTNYLYSEKLNVSNGNYLYLTNINGTNTIAVDYQARGTYLPSGSGADTITIKVTNTTNVPDGSSGISNLWKSSLYAALSQSFADAGTNSFYPTQSLLVRKKPPQAVAYLSPTAVSNTLVSNTYSYVIQNSATEVQNKIKVAQIQIPTVFTNAVNLTSASNGYITTYSSNGNLWVHISYTNDIMVDNSIPANNGFDVISMTLLDSIPALSDITNADVPCFVDNLNGDFWVAASAESSLGWTAGFYTPPASAYAFIDTPKAESGSGFYHHIYTDLDVTNVVLRIQNSSEEGNEIEKARIVFPTGVTNVIYTSDTKLAVAVLSNERTNVGAGITNTNFVLYLQYTNTLKPKTGAVPLQEDYVTVSIADAIDTPQDLPILVYIKNSKTNYFAASQSPDNAVLSFIYPPLSANGHVDLTDGFIDWSTDTNLVSYMITNTGRSKNTILQAKIAIPPSISTNVINITSALVTNNAFINYSGNQITVTYEGSGTNFAGGLQDTISFQMIDIVTNSLSVRLTNSVTNYRTNGVLAESAVDAQLLNFQTPPVLATFRVDPTVLFITNNASVTTDAIVITVTNKGNGNNNINQVQINPPFALAKIVDIYDELMNTNKSLAPGLFQYLGGNIYLLYNNSATNLTAGGVDRITIYLRNDYSSEQNMTWTALADNDLLDAIALTNLLATPGGTNKTYITERVYASLSPNTLLTSTESNYITYTIKNGTVGDGTGRPIQKAIIQVPDPFTNITQITTEQPSVVSISNISGTMKWLVVNYTGGLQAGEADNIRFYLQDNWVIGETITNLQSTVDYQDNGGLRDTLVESGKSMSTAFTFPPASASGYIVSGDRVPEDFTNYQYQFYLRNTGDVGNNIKMVKITPPATITNIVTVNSLSKGFAGTFDGTNVWLNYAAAGKEMQSLETDTISLMGYDNVNTGDVSSNWGIQVANTTTNLATYLTNITVPAPKNLTNIIYHPAYQTAVYLEATNSIDSSDSNINKVWTTRATNYFKFYLYNQSASGNNILKTKIYLPSAGQIFLTNSISVTNAKSATITITNNAHAIEIVYASPIVPGDYDVVSIGLVDNWKYGETNVEWTNDVAYDTTDGRYKAAAEYTGKSRKCYFVMPQPVASAAIVTPSTREVYTKTTNFTIAYQINNLGDGSSDVFKATLSIPQPYWAAFGPASVSNSLATNVSFNSVSGMVTLSYSNNFVPGTNDLIYLSFQGAVLPVTNYVIDCQVSNATYTATAGETVSDSRKLSIITVPTYYVSPTALSTITSTNDVNVFVMNNTGGKSKLKQVVLTLAAPFTNVIQTNSLTITNQSHISGTITNITLDYSADGREISGYGGNDAVTLRLLDNLDIGDLDTAITARAYNGFVWIDMEKDTLGQTNISFTMPAVVATAKLNYSQLYTSAENTNIGVKVYNKGSGSNKISKLRLFIPIELTNRTFISNQSYSDASGSFTSNMLEIAYQNTNLFASGATDTIWISFSNTIDYGTNITFDLTAVNLTNGSIEPRFASVSGEGGSASLNLRFDFPQVSAQGYINGRSTLYTISTNDQIEYRLVNHAVNAVISNARIYYDTNLIQITSVSNTWAGAVVTLQTNESGSNCMNIEYPTGIPFGQRDIFKLNLVYSITNLTNITLESKVWLNGITNAQIATVDGGFTQILSVNQANWGMVQGSLYPQGYEVTAKIYYPQTKTLMTNIDGASAGTLSGTNGVYFFTMIPSGDYDVEFSATNFRTMRKSITIQSNMMNLISTVTLQNAPLNPDSGALQQIVCYDDQKTKIEFPTSSIERDFSIDISVVDLTTPQKDNLGQNTWVKAPNSTANLKGYQFSILNLTGDSLEGEALKLDATISLAYDLTNIQARGWNEDDLAVYYWDRVTSRWIKVGGRVDKLNQLVVAKVSYVHGIYGIFGGPKAEGIIQNVVVRPKIFTPTKDENGYFGTVRITFELDAAAAANGFTVKIFDIRGNLIRTFERLGDYAQGEIAWDSKDNEGYAVKSGVYIYRVLAGGQSYTGTIIIAR